MFLDYKDLAQNNELDKSFNHDVGNLIQKKKTVFNLIFNDDFSFLKEFEKICDDFIGFWCSKDLPNLQEQINYLSRIEQIPNPDHYFNVLEEKEIIVTLVEIVSVFTNDDDLNDESNSFLLDYIEGNQQLLVDSYNLLFRIANITPKAVETLLSLDIIDIICQNVLESYSELTRIAALDLLGAVIGSEQSLLKFSKYSDFIEFLSSEFLPISNSQEACTAVAKFVTSLSRLSESSIIDCFKEKMISVLVTILQLSPEFAEDCTCGLFYIMYHNHKCITFELIDLIISHSTTIDNQIILYYSIQIMKLALSHLKEKEQINTLISHINLSYLNTFYQENFHLPICYACTKFFLLMFHLGPEYIHLALINDNISTMCIAYENMSHEVRTVILEAIDILVICSSNEQLDLLLANGTHSMIIDSLQTQTNTKLMVNALLAISNHSPETLRDDNTIKELIQFYDTIEDKETLNKLDFILTTLTTQEDSTS